MVPFIIIIRVSFDYDYLVPWIKQAISSILRYTKMTVIRADGRLISWNTIPITTIKSLAASIKIFIPITILAQEAP